jgi:hypothetical protein
VDHQFVIVVQVMFGSASEFFYRHLAGIQQAPGSRGYRMIRFRPSILFSTGDGAATLSLVCANLSAVDASMHRPIGTIKASWACKMGTTNTTNSSNLVAGISDVLQLLEYNVSTPVGVASTVQMPALSGAKGAKVRDLYLEN